MLTVPESLESATSQQAGDVRVAMTRAKTSAEEDEAVVENRSAVRIKRIAAAAKEVDEVGIQFEPFPRAPQVEFVKSGACP